MSFFLQGASLSLMVVVRECLRASTCEFTDDEDLIHAEVGRSRAKYRHVFRALLNKDYTAIFAQPCRSG